jgi:ABC-type nickel/cobalt efflux system permease component RcnA
VKLLPGFLPLVFPLVAAAHPLGNFTINRYAALHLGQHALGIHYVVDMAEIPAFQTISEIDRNRNGTIDPDEREVYLSRAPADLERHLTLTVDGREVPLTAGRRSFSLPPGAGGLPTLRLEVSFEASLPAARGAVEFRDGNFPDRLGWQEIIADAGEGIALAESTVPRTDQSRELRDYPTDLLASPPHVTEARFRMVTATASDALAAAAAPRPVPAGPGGFRDRLTELITTGAPLGPRLVLTSLLVAAALGALHALSPGHGKTIVGAYLVGARGTARHALVLGLVVTATHTLGVYALGLVTLTASHYVVPEQLFPWLGAASGLLVLGIGASLATSRLEAARSGHDHAHGHDHGHGHHHHHGHDHDHPHAHVEGEGALSWRRLFALGVSGGLLPCPSALVVMLGAIALGRIAFGLLLIVAFSVGLAAVLTAIGLLFVYARRWFNHLPADGRVARYVPVASALVISVAGLLIVVQALVQMGVLRAWT